MSRAIRESQVVNHFRYDRVLLDKWLGARFRQRATKVLGLVVLGALLASCGHADDGATVGSTANVATSASAEAPIVEKTTTGAPIPPRPDIAKPAAPLLDGSDEENAYAVAKYMADSYEYMYARSDSEPWLRFAADECEYCQKIIAAVNADKETGEWAATKLSVLDTRMYKGVNPKEFEVHFLIEQSDTVEHKVDETVENKGDLYTFVVGLNGETTWKVIGITISDPKTFEEGR